MLKKLIALSLILALTAFGLGGATAQQVSPGAPVTQTGSTGLAGQQCIQSTGTSSVALTITVPQPQAGNSVYIDYLVLAIASTGAVTTVSTPTTFTSTNIPGTPSWPVTQAGLSSAGFVQAAAGANGALGIPIKGASGLGPTFVGPVANAGFFDIMTVCFHSAP
ncbi:MAG: hypothetical protein E6J45_11205 [Chloroflexi bacterium]|nr:MAG: hypothetical protein E6J45_11205 [Chloroflexota bacterium]